MFLLLILLNEVPNRYRSIHAGKTQRRYKYSALMNVLIFFQAADQPVWYLIQYLSMHV